MSEYQFVSFRAIDGPVSKANLRFMHEQSSRAEITPWLFDNEYHYGDFHGDAAEMLRRGYDFYFHYANFGIRNLMIRLPNGLPDTKAAEPYLEEDSQYFAKDKHGPGGNLCIEPCLEAGELDDLWTIDEILERLLPLRAEILDGDLRPFYLARLAIAYDQNHDPEEEREGPVPAGLKKHSDAQQALAELYGLGTALIAAAAKESPALPGRRDSADEHASWLGKQLEATKNAWLAQLMADPRSSVRGEILAEFQKTRSAFAWPTSRPDRAIAELLDASEEIQAKNDRKRAANAARQRAKKLADMAGDPERTFRETEALVKQRSTDGYRKAATLLADVREALAGTDRFELAEHQALKLKKKHPTLKHLTAELRKKGFLAK